jgi:hypothetical protein
VIRFNTSINDGRAGDKGAIATHGAINDSYLHDNKFRFTIEGLVSGTGSLFRAYNPIMSGIEISYNEFILGDDIELPDFLNDPSKIHLICNTVRFVNESDKFVPFNDNSQILTYAASIDWDVSAGNVASLTLTGNATISLVNLVKHQTGILKVIQGTGAPFTLGIEDSLVPSDYALSTAETNVDILKFYYDGTDIFWTFENYG